MFEFVKSIKLVFSAAERERVAKLHAEGAIQAHIAMQTASAQHTVVNLLVGNQRNLAESLATGSVHDTLFYAEKVQQLSEESSANALKIANATRRAMELRDRL